MSEKTKPDQQVSVPETQPKEVPEYPEAEPNEVPEWLAGQLRRMNDKVMQEKLPDDLLGLLRQIESNERNR